MVKSAAQILKPVAALIPPKPVVLVTCIDNEGKPNIITIAAVNTASYEPPMFVIAVRHDRYSNQLIDKTREYVINVPTTNLVKEVHFCGRNSGRNVDKFKETKLTPVTGKVIKAPLIAECPINIECKVVMAIKPGSHTLFFGEVVATHVEEGAFDGTKLNVRLFPTLAWNTVEFLGLGETILRE